jgi:hypothetical protein
MGERKGSEERERLERRIGMKQFSSFMIDGSVRLSRICNRPYSLNRCRTMIDPISMGT